MIRSVLLETPPNVGGGVRDLITALTVGNRLRRMGMQAQSDLLELFGKSAGDMLDQWFETDVLKGLMGFDAITGNYASPYASGTAYVLLHHVFGEVNGVKGAWGQRSGGWAPSPRPWLAHVGKPASRSGPEVPSAKSL